MLKKALLLLCLCLFQPSVEGKLSSTDWRGLQKKLISAYKDKDYEELGQVFGEIGRDNSKRAVKLLIKVLKKTIRKDPCYARGVQALAGMQSLKAQSEIGRRATKSSTDWRVRLLIVDVMAKWPGKKCQPYLIKNITTSKQKVASASIRLLAQKGDRQAIDPLIKKMTRLDKKKGVIWEDCRYALSRLLGARLGSGMEYKSLVSIRGYKKQVTASGSRPHGRRGSVVRGFFGLSITCKKSVFIIDVSGSMKTIDPTPVGSGGHYGTTGRNEVGKLDPARMRIRRAKKELVKVIGLLKSSQKFNIVAFSHDVWVWSKRGCKSASSTNKASAIRFVQNFKAEGVTVTDLALTRAYQTSPRAECFYLLSDGAPTRDGQNIIPTQAILELILQQDRFRRIKIHTLGFRGAKVEFMKAVANLTSGTYRDIK